MEGFESIVDAVGGISIVNELDFHVDDHVFPEGEIQLDGEAALSYVRMRYEDPRGDFGRQDRQKKIIEGVLRKGASLTGLMNYKGIFNALGDNVRTNMTFDEMIDVQKNYRSALGKVEQLHFQDGNGQKMNGIWYYLMDDEELAEGIEGIEGAFGVVGCLGFAECCELFRLCCLLYTICCFLI